MKKAIISIIILIIITLGAIGCATYKPNENGSKLQADVVVATVDNRDADGNLYYGTANYPEGRRDEMMAKWAELNG